jgi:hypothetical protein
MKRIRRISIEVEQREITLYATSSSWSNPEDQNTSAAEPTLVVPETGMISEELATALKERRVHLHRSSEGQLIVCDRRDCNE